MDKFCIVEITRLQARQFCDMCSTFSCDIDLIDGSNVLDAKDFDHVVLLSFNKKFCVSMNSNDLDEISRFNEAMKKYEVM